MSDTASQRPQRDGLPLIRIYYDARCPVCRRERARYERLSRQDANVEWWDATDNAEHLAARELSSSLVYGGQKEGWRILLIDHARSQPA